MGNPSIESTQAKLRALLSNNWLIATLTIIMDAKVDRQRQPLNGWWTALLAQQLRTHTREPTARHCAVRGRPGNSPPVQPSVNFGECRRHMAALRRRCVE